MLEIIIATHGTLAEGFKNAVEVIAVKRIISIQLV